VVRKVLIFKKSDNTTLYIVETPPTSDTILSASAYCLLLPIKSLNLSALLTLKKFCGKGNKKGALAAFKELDKSGLGKLIITESSRGTAMV